MNSKRSGTVRGDGDQDRGLMPKLRFPEFREAGNWLPRELNKLLSEPKQRNRDLTYGPEHVLSVSGEHGCVNQIELMGRSYAGVTVKDYHVVKSGDVVYTKSPLKAAPYGIIKANKGPDGIVSTLYAVYRPTANSSADYIDHFFSGSYNLNSYLQPLVKKGAKNDMKVNNAAVLTGVIYAPDKDEQQKIADCLSSLDAVIAVEGERLAALKAHKKGLMQALFPAPGQTNPSLRFPEFKGAEEWKVKTIGNSSVSFSGGTPSSTNGKFYGGGIPFIRSAEIASGKTELTLSRDGLTKSAAKLVEVGDVLLALYGANSGNPAIARINGAINQAVLCIRHESDNRFLFQFLCYRQFWIKQTYLQGGQGNISGDIVKSVPISTPPPPEQSRIATFLEEIDISIQCQADKVDALRMHKSSLMQKLFPSPAEATE